MARRVLGVFLIVLLAGCRAPSPVGMPAATGATAFRLESSAFAADTAIPRQYTCDGGNQSPPLHWAGLPQGTQSLALIVEDPDAPRGTFVHWVLYDLPPQPPELQEGMPQQVNLGNGARQGQNGSGRTGYGGPCPPVGPAHHYHFQMYALNAMIDPPPSTTASGLRSSMEGHVLGQAELVGTYGR